MKINVVLGAIIVAIGPFLTIDSAQAAYLFTDTTKAAFNQNAMAAQDLLDDGSNAIFGTQPFPSDQDHQTTPLSRGSGMYQYTLADIVFNESDPLASPTDSYLYEAGPIGGNGVGQVVNSNPGVWGIDSDTDGTATEKGISGLKVTFSRPVSTFGLELFDFESGISPARLLAYLGGDQVYQQSLGDGNGSAYFAGLVGTDSMTFDSVIYVLGGTSLSTANSNHWAAGNFSFGEPVAVPTPALLPGLVGMGLSLWRKRNQQDAV
jgi:hypothetical protein